MSCVSHLLVGSKMGPMCLQLKIVCSTLRVSNYVRAKKNIFLISLLIVL